MAVYTHIDAELLAKFLSGYDIGAPLVFKGIAEGISNSNYFLQTDVDRYILTLYEMRANTKDLPYFLDVMHHLADAGLPCPLPVDDKKGVSLQKLADRDACIISFLDGVSVSHPTAEQCASVGKVLADMHVAAGSFTQSRDNELSVQGWKDLASSVRDQADTITPGLAKLIDDEIAYLEDHWPTDLPSGLVHADLFPDNVLFTGDKLTGIIDFYFACSDMFAYDIAVCINAWCFDEDHQFLTSHAKRLTEMYDIVRPLTAAEVEALPILCRGAAMRFLITRVYDWLNPVSDAIVRAKDPLDYVKRLAFHQHVKDAADYVI
jgi:homoserine kinase type II